MIRFALLRLRVPFVVLLVAALVSCGSEREQPLPEQPVRIASGLKGGVYRVYGRALAREINAHLPHLRATALTTEGSVDNLQRLNEGRAEVAFTLADTAAAAIEGTGPFTRPIALAALARLYEDYVQVIVRDDSDIDSIADLSRRRISIGAPRSGTALMAKRILRLSALKLRGSRSPHIEQLPLRESADALAGGRIEAFFWSGGLPTQAIETLRDKVDIKLIDLPAGVAELDPNLYTETQIPKSVYKAKRAVSTVTASNLLVVRADMPTEVAYRITALLFDRQRQLEKQHPEGKRLNLRDAIATYPLGLHPGARKLYQEQRR